jgi:hypothetical protein
VAIHFMHGLNVEEVAGLLGLSTATVKRETATAGAWLYRELRGAAASRRRRRLIHGRVRAAPPAAGSVPQQERAICELIPSANFLRLLQS